MAFHRWEGAVQVDLHGTTAMDAWSVIRSSFHTLHSHTPTIAGCRHVGGDEGAPGSLRVTWSPELPSIDGSPVGWVKEKLLLLDDHNMIMSSCVVEGNVGYKEFTTTRTVSSMGHGGCRLELRYHGDPVEGWTKAKLDEFLRLSMNHIAQSVRDRTGGLRVDAAGSSEVPSPRA